MPDTDPGRLSERLRQLQAEGRYTISLEELERTANGSRSSLQSAIKRLKRQGRLASPRRGFYVVVPPEYTSIGSPPAAWFIDDLMRFVERPYYVGLLSAAALHGAAHQHPQVFQVVTDRPIAPMRSGRVKLEFFRKRRLGESSVTRVNTETGTMVVATPETTVFDLIRHAGACGHLDNVATVLAELSDELTPRALELAASNAHLSEVQRAGYLLELVGREDLARALEKFLEGRSVQIVPLRPGVAGGEVPRSRRWKLDLNADVEPDL